MASSPGSLTHSRGGRGTKRESLVHALIMSVITCVCVILENIQRYPSWVCTKILKDTKMYWRTCGYAERVGRSPINAELVAAHTTASDCLLGQSLVKIVAT